jgi:hypothetical protein
MDYQITLRVPFSALDDLQAREIAKTILYDVGSHLLNEKTEKKLQRVYKDRPPDRLVI